MSLSTIVFVSKANGELEYIAQKHLFADAATRRARRSESFKDVCAMQKSIQDRVEPTLGALSWSLLQSCQVGDPTWFGMLMDVVNITQGEAKGWIGFTDHDDGKCDYVRVTETDADAFLRWFLSQVRSSSQIRHRLRLLAAQGVFETGNDLHLEISADLPHPWNV